MLDFRALEKSHAAINTVWDRGIEERVLEHPRLRIRPIEHAHVRQHDTVAAESLDHVDDEPRLIEVGSCGERAHRLAFALGGPQILPEPSLVLLDQRIGRIEDIAVRPIVLLELRLNRTGMSARLKSRSNCCMLASFAPRNA